MASPATPAKARRIGLYAPFILLAMAVAAWTGVWFWLRGEALRRLDAAAAGGGLTWQQRSVHGFPFRLDVDFVNLAWRGPDGRGLMAARLKTEAMAFKPDHWVAVAPDGVTLLRPDGPVVIRAQVLRASLSQAVSHPPTLAVEGLGLIFTPGPGSKPFPLSSADELHIHTRAGPLDQGAVYLELDGARVAPDSLIGLLAHGAPATLVVDGIFSHASSFAGRTLPAAVAGWSQAGGRLRARTLRLTARGVALDASDATLGVDAGGRLQGAFGADVRLDAAPASGRTTFTLDNGRARLGLADIGPAPRIY